MMELLKTKNMKEKEAGKIKRRMDGWEEVSKLLKKEGKKGKGRKETSKQAGK